MTRSQTIFSVVALTVLLVGGYVYVAKSPKAYFSKNFSAPKEVSSEANGIPAGFAPFVSPPYGFGFLYPSKYYVGASELDASTTPHLAVLLVLDTQEHRDIMEGKVPAPREGATGITVNVYRNPQKLSAAEWAPSDMNWNISNKQLATTTVAGKEGVVFRWSGLYEGASIVVTRGDFAYILAVSWMSEKDPILPDFDKVLQSFRFVDEEGRVAK